MVKRDELKETMCDLDITEADRELLQTIFGEETIEALEKEIEEEDKVACMDTERIKDWKSERTVAVRNGAKSGELIVSGNYKPYLYEAKDGTERIYFKRKE